MMTEKEAAEKWCPFARVLFTRGVDNYGVAYNRPGSDNNMCHGSGCMAWRWGGNQILHEMKDGDPAGYCGLAGRPS